MFSAPITSLLESKLPQLPKLLAAPSFRHDFDDLLAMLPAPDTIALIDDHDTSAALGDALFRALKSRYTITRIACGKAPVADRETIESIRSKTKKSQLFIGVGSGTISDLCKYASHLDGKPYIMFPTAASMNGYLSANASITIDGYKTTLPAHLPQAVFCDYGVIAAAPARLHKSGLGDSLARPTAQVDWRLSHLLLGTPYDETPFQLTQELEPGLFDSARGLALSDPSSVKLLMQSLLLSGLGMTIAGGSYPASQSEHMIAHAFEMLKPSAPPSLHGEQIGVTAITAATRHEQLFTKIPTLASMEFPGDIKAAFGEAAADTAKTAFRAKQEKVEEAMLTNDIIKKRWHDIAHALHPLMLSSARITEILTQAQAPRRTESLGWQAADYAAAQKYARYLRDRFTGLDLDPA